MAPPAAMRRRGPREIAHNQPKRMGAFAPGAAEWHASPGGDGIAERRSCNRVLIHLRLIDKRCRQVGGQEG